ncbi:MAG TPA: glycine cleavage system protein GcvH [Anaerolineae bacterium]|nr:glycine cleavage system protein GcvH [Anaerolineae bacterium]
MDVPRDLRYTREHEWIRMEDSRAQVGITDYAQDQLGDIVYVELPEPGTQVAFMEPFGVVESVKAASDLFSPVSGQIVEINERLEDQPELVNQDPYGEGWMIVVEVSEPAELDQLLSPEEYAALLEEVEE